MNRLETMKVKVLSTLWSILVIAVVESTVVDGFKVYGNQILHAGILESI